MLGIFKTCDVKLTVDQKPFLQLGSEHPLAIDTLRKLPGQPYKLNEDGIPNLHRTNLDQLTERATDLQRYVKRIYDLNELWQRLISDRDAFNHELTRFPHHDFKRPSYLEEYGITASVIDAAVAELSDNSTKGNRTDNPEGEKFDLSSLGLTMDTSPAARENRAKYLKENRERHEALRIEPYWKVLGTFALFAPDPGYLLAILGAFENGLKHIDPEVRKSTIVVLNALSKGVLIGLNRDFEKMELGKNVHLRSEYAKDTFSILNAVLKLLYSKHYGVNDSDLTVQAQAIELEKDLIYACATVKPLIIHDEGKKIIITN